MLSRPDRGVRSALCSREQKACDQDQGDALCVARRRAHLLSLIKLLVGTSSGGYTTCVPINIVVVVLLMQEHKGRRRVVESIIGLSNDDLVHLCASIVDLAMSRLLPIRIA